jgi:hypothetical protein
MPERLTIIFSGMIASDPHQGGATWAVLQYLLGLKRLGHRVYFIEPLQPTALKPDGGPFESSINAQYFQQVMAEFGLEDSSSLLLADTQRTVGMPYPKLVDIARRADALINISGMLSDEQLLNHIPVRIYLDLDPAFIQLWQAVQAIDMRFAAHTHFVTIGLAMGQPNCIIPSCGRDWITTLQPIVLERWPTAEKVLYAGLTTIANWRGYGSIEHQGILYGQKVHSLRQLMTLPTQTKVPCMPALAIHPAETKDLAALAENHWQCLDPALVAGTPQAYQAFIRGSWAELGVAKSGYVQSQCGWFSDRSICYLASGRPVLAQATGFSSFLPCGEGLLSFSSIAEALEGIESLQADYVRHARAARAIACEYFDSDKVLRKLLDRCGLI